MMADRQMKHTPTVQGFDGTHAQLAERIGDLYYDSFAGFLDLLARKIAADSNADVGRGRPKLAADLAGCAEHLSVAARHIDEAWRICQPHVAHEAHEKASTST
jgi:hypothetical protein